MGTGNSAKRKKRKTIVDALVDAGMPPERAETFAPKLNEALGRRNMTIREQKTEFRPFPSRMPRWMM